MPFPPGFRPNYRMPQAANIPLGDYHLRVHDRSPRWGGPDYHGYVLVPQFHPHDPNLALWMMADGQPHGLDSSQLQRWHHHSFFTPGSFSHFMGPNYDQELSKNILRQLNPYELLRARGEAPGTAPGTHPLDWMSRLVFADYLDDHGITDQYGESMGDHERRWAKHIRDRILNPLHNPAAPALVHEMSTWPDRIAAGANAFDPHVLHPQGFDAMHSDEQGNLYSSGVGPTQYGSDVENLLAALQHPDQHEHRLGLDEPLHGPRGMLADALADAGRHAEAAIAAEPNRAVMVGDNRLFPANRIPYPGLYHSIIQHASITSDAHANASPEPINPLVDGYGNGLLRFWPQGAIPGWDAVGGPETGHATHEDAQGGRLPTAVPSQHVRVGNYGFAEDVPIHRLPGYLADLMESHVEHTMGPNHGLDEHINQLRNHPLVEVDTNKLNEMMQSGHYAQYVHSVQSAYSEDAAPQGAEFQGSDRDYWRQYKPEQPAHYGEGEVDDRQVGTFWHDRGTMGSTALSPPERLLVGVDPIQNLTATAGWEDVWRELHSMLRHRHRQGQML